MFGSFKADVQELYLSRTISPHYVLALCPKQVKDQHAMNGAIILLITDIITHVIGIYVSH